MKKTSTPGNTERRDGSQSSGVGGQNQARGPSTTVSTKSGPPFFLRAFQAPVFFTLCLGGIVLTTGTLASLTTVEMLV